MEHRRILFCEEHDHGLTRIGTGSSRRAGQPPEHCVHEIALPLLGEAVGEIRELGPQCAAEAVALSDGFGAMKPGVRAGGHLPPDLQPRIVAMQRFGGMSAPADRLGGLTQREDQPDSDHERQGERHGTDRHRDPRPDEGVVLHRDREGRPAYGRSRRETGRRIRHGADAMLRLTTLQGGAICTVRPPAPHLTPVHRDADGGQLSAVAFRGDEGEVLRQASAVVGRPVVLWEVIGPHHAIPRASSGPDVGARPPGFDLDAILQRWNIPVSIGSRWVTAPGDTAESWVVAPVRSRPPAPPPGGRERRSRARMALELAGLVLGMIGSPVAASASASGTPSAKPPEAMLAHQVNNPLTAAPAALQLSMESSGLWVDLAADRRLALLDDLGQVLEDLDRTAEMLRAMKESARTGALTARAERGGRFDAVRVVRSCLTLERRLLRDRGIELEFATALESLYLKGDPNALFDLLVSLIRTAADPGGSAP